MEIVSPVRKTTRRATDNWFSGTVWQDPVIDAPEPARLSAFRVTFEPGARTAWHTHPLGQTLHILSGIGIVQSSGKPAMLVRAGDTVWIDPGEKHWHGAAPGHVMVHLAMQEKENGSAADWMEKVTDADYATAAREALGPAA